MTVQAKILDTASGSELAGKLPAAIFAILLGSFLFLGVAFAQPDAIHNAAHDGRHAFSFPCH